MKSLLLPAAAGVLALSLAPASATPGTSGLTGSTGVVAAFTLVVPGSAAASHLQARAVVPTGVPCPEMDVQTAKGHRSIPMSMRVPGPSTGAAFASMRACEAPLPVRAKGASIAGMKIPAALPKRVDKIAMIGDTGCRVTRTMQQACSDPAGWPLATNARAVAKEKPDLTIFTGDFYYREDPCPDSAATLCGGSPPPIAGSGFTDTDYGWAADVFIPMAAMFRAAPILALRGNHEACFRGGNGFFLFFDASPLGADACAPTAGKTTANVVPTWAVDLPIAKHRTLRTVVVDSAYGKNSELSSWVGTQREAYKDAHALAATKSGRESWLLTHRPMFGVDTVEESNGKPTWNQWTSVDQTAAAHGLIDTYDLMVASHVHVAQVVHVPGQPSQIVVGNGGSVPDAMTGFDKPAYGPLRDGQGKELDPQYPAYPNADYLWTAVEYGYTVATPGRAAHRWSLAQKDTSGHTFATCEVGTRTPTCG